MTSTRNVHLPYKPERLLTTFLLLIFIYLPTYSSGAQPCLSTEQAHILILNERLDSLRASTICSSDLSKPLNYLINIQKGTASYQDYLQFIENIEKISNDDFSKLIIYIDQLPEPKASEGFRDAYFQLQIYKIAFLRNKVLDIDKSLSAFEDLTKYYEQYYPNENNRSRERIVLDMQPLFINVIEKNLSGKKKALVLLEESKTINDTTLMIELLLLINNFVIEEGDLNSYINNAETAYSLDNALNNHSAFFPELMIQLINSLSFAGGQEERVFKLLKELYQTQSARADSYSLFMQFLRDNRRNDGYLKEILSVFNVPDLAQLTERLIREASDKLDGISLVHLYREAGMMLTSYGIYDKGNNYLNEALNISRTIYTADLAKAVANYEKSIIQKEKEKEVALAQEKSNFYMTMTWIVGGFTLMVLVLLIITYRNTQLLKKQSKELSLQNQLIARQKAEKELLFSEMQHRVKNNFEIILSLMKTQAEEVSDEKHQDLFAKSAQRVHVLSLVHDCLFDESSLDIDLQSYLRRLINQLFYSFSDTTTPALNIDIPELTIKMNEGIILGLITNELVTNAFKYGFDTTHPKLDYHIVEAGDGYRIDVFDNGKKSAIITHTGLGLTLVKKLAVQLKGQFTFNEATNTFSVDFKIT